jgi:hypothetical protein
MPFIRTRYHGTLSDARMHADTAKTKFSRHMFRLARFVRCESSVASVGVDTAHLIADQVQSTKQHLSWRGHCSEKEAFLKHGRGCALA